MRPTLPILPILPSLTTPPTHRSQPDARRPAQIQPHQTTGKVIGVNPQTMTRIGFSSLGVTFEA
ncbi:MAG: hypothetical protein HC795_06650 [Coleofasciculaceae cyanobacterium RL_1_1]|nr:hypothetical protein [Coleofasciculaceae cyanobacterium RL_1_1]